MKRRTALKNLLLASGGTLIAPLWAINWTKESLPNYNSAFNTYQERQLTAIVDTILPNNGEIGGLSVSVNTFLIGLISACFDANFQQTIKDKLKHLDQQSEVTFGRPFSDCSQEEREQMLLKFEQGNEQEKDFFEFMKDETIRGFETSEEVLVNYRGYVLMPGFYDGDVQLEEY